MLDKTQNYPEIESLNGAAEKLIVLLHGVGSDGHDLISLVPFVQNALPHCHFFAPHGVEKYDMAPYGYQWFSLKNRSAEIITELAKTNAVKLEKIIQDKQQELSLTNKETILVGFSQGTMMGVYLTLTQKMPYAATVGFSGMLIPPPILNNITTPICLIHGKEDRIVESVKSEEMAQYFKNNNIAHQLKIIPNLGHSIDASGIEFAVKFLKDK